ncbi:MAG: hypothetical protein BWY75_03128 [bacterium ADurb.Bin425]|nr:MAG: hypothetical protein BWY75_03128 [bacterium ADurb.Bin425]
MFGLDRHIKGVHESHIFRQAVHVAGRHHHIFHRQTAVFQGTLYQIGFSFAQSACPGRSLHQNHQLFHRRRSLFCLAAAGHAGQAHEQCRGLGDEPEEGRGQTTEENKGNRQRQSNLFRTAQAYQFGHLLADDDVQEGENDKRKGHSHEVRYLPGAQLGQNMGGSVDAGFQNCLDRLDADGTGSKTHDRDAQLCAGHRIVQFIRKVLHGLGTAHPLFDHLLNASLAQANEGKLNRYEETIDEHKHHEKTQPQPG